MTRTHRHRSPLSPTIRAWRTIWLGALLGLLGGGLSLIGIGLVGPRASLNLAPDLDADVAGAARAVLPAISGGPEWRLVSRIGTPWGDVARLRPFVEGIEVRGADCVIPLQAATNANVATPAEPDLGATIERDPSEVAWAELAVSLRGVRTRFRAAAKAPTFLAGGESLAVRFAGDPQPALFAELLDGGDPPFLLGVEATVSGPPASLRQAWRGMVWSGAPAAAAGPVDLRLTLDPRTLSLLSARDLRFPARYNGSALVFDPNPVVTSGRGDLRDGDAVDEYRRWVVAPRLDGSGYLHGSFVEAISDWPPEAKEPGLVYSYPSADPRFDEAMAYVFGDRSLARADSLGFTGLFIRPLRMHLHATPVDNSWYSRPSHEVILGDGGVDDAQDGDIVIHETGHALHDALVPGFGDGDTRAISEGFADFWAASLTGEPCVGDWDATSYSPPCLRRADQSAVWPVWLNGQAHHDGAIWSGLLWDLRRRFGPVEGERLALAALVEQGTRTRWPEAARGLLRAAGRIGLGEHLDVVREALADRGLMPREISFDLAPGESRRIGLLVPGRFAGHPVRELQVWGDGRIEFEPAAGGAGALPFPAGPPTAIPCGVDPATGGNRPGESAGALNLSVRGTVDGTTADLSLSWSRDGTETARVHARWEGAEGSLTWEYEDARPGETVPSFISGASAGGVPADSIPEVEVASIPRAGIGGLQGFRLRMPEAGGDLAEIVGTRLRVEEDPDHEGFRLLRTSLPMRPAGRTMVLAAQPNPFRAATEIRIRRDFAAPAQVAIFDVLGRRVRNLGATTAEPGIVSVRWDGRDDAGRPLASGVYWARAECGGTRAGMRLVITR